jgi:hypothetical protein
MKTVATALLALGVTQVVEARNSLSRTPPMGWMSWELFRCDTDCTDSDPATTKCIHENMYKSQVDGLANGGFVAAGYTGIHMDDCWEQKKPARDPATNELVADPKRFPSGLKALGDYMHAKNATFGLYTAESPTTCGGYPASAGHEALDAKTFAKWGVDYMKVCVRVLLSPWADTLTVVVRGQCWGPGRRLRAEGILRGRLQGHGRGAGGVRPRPGAPPLCVCVLVLITVVRPRRRLGSGCPRPRERDKRHSLHKLQNTH